MKCELKFIRYNVIYHLTFILSDIDECDPAKPLHRCGQICENTLGGYNCACQKGFQLSKDGYGCEGITSFQTLNMKKFFFIFTVDV